MRAFVTGATGFVGSHVVDRLRTEGHSVTALVRSRAKAERVFDEPPDLVDGDLSDPSLLARSIDGHDVVFHVAGLVAARDEAEFMRVNRDGTRHVVSAAETAGSRLVVMVSSMAAAGPSRADEPLVGDAARSPVTAYGRSKLAAEEIVRHAMVEWTMMRPPMVYGPRDTEVLKVFRAARAGFVPLFGRADQQLSAVYVEDLARAVVCVAERPVALGKTYYPCHPRSFTSESFARAVGRAVGRSVRTVTVPGVLTRALLQLTGGVARLAGRRTILNADKANELLQAAWVGDPGPLMRDTEWRAEYDLDSGLDRTAAWYRGRGLI